MGAGRIRRAKALIGISVSERDIALGLREIGVKPGMRLMVHSSLSSFGHVEGGAEAVIGALQACIGPEGTLLMPSFNHDSIFAEGKGVYDPRSTPTTDGRVADTFWRMPGVERSLNPTHAFAAWGRDAARYLTGHHLTLTMGEDSPLGLLAREGGYQLNLGTTHAASTAKHVAETMRRVPCLGYRAEQYPVRMPSGAIQLNRTWGWRENSCPRTESGKLIETELEKAGAQIKENIGNCRVTFLKVWDCLEAVWRLLDRGDDGSPVCPRCPIRPRKVKASVLSDWNAR